VQNLFRKELKGKLPFMTNGPKFAADTITTLLAGLESRLQPALKSIQGALNVAMMNNIRYVLVGVAEHGQLPAVLGNNWKEFHERMLEQRVLDYYQEVWTPIVQLLQALRDDLKGEVCQFWGLPELA
jgi:hypothetical protein